MEFVRWSDSERGRPSKMVRSTCRFGPESWWMLETHWPCSLKFAEVRVIHSLRLSAVDDLSKTSPIWAYPS